jgi:hypothetical protein
MWHHVIVIFVAAALLGLAVWLSGRIAIEEALLMAFKGVRPCIMS